MPSDLGLHHLRHSNLTAFPPRSFEQHKYRETEGATRRACTVPIERGGRCAGGQATGYPADEHCTWKRWGSPQSGDVKGAIAPASDPGLAEPDDDPDGDDI